MQQTTLKEQKKMKRKIIKEQSYIEKEEELKRNNHNSNYCFRTKRSLLSEVEG